MGQKHDVTEATRLEAELKILTAMGDFFKEHVRVGPSEAEKLGMCWYWLNNAKSLLSNELKRAKSEEKAKAKSESGS